VHATTATNATPENRAFICFVLLEALHLPQIILTTEALPRAFFGDLTGSAALVVAPGLALEVHPTWDKSVTLGLLWLELLAERAFRKVVGHSAQLRGHWAWNSLQGAAGENPPYPVSTWAVGQASQ
jgi:hypothetical protein